MTNVPLPVLVIRLLPVGRSPSMLNVLVTIFQVQFTPAAIGT